MRKAAAAAGGGRLQWADVSTERGDNTKAISSTYRGRSLHLRSCDG